MPDRTGQTVLVTGGAGFIGSHLCEALVARGDRVIAYDSFDPFYDVAIKRRNIETLQKSDGFDLVDRRSSGQHGFVIA